MQYAYSRKCGKLLKHKEKRFFFLENVLWLTICNLHDIIIYTIAPEIYRVKEKTKNDTKTTTGKGTEGSLGNWIKN